MKTRPARRFGILVLALALVPGQFSTADAGVIPWLYDAVFGPVGHYGYGGHGYAGGYGYGVPSTYSYYRGPRIGYAAPSSTYRSSNCGPAGCGPTGCATASYCVSYSPFFGIPQLCPTGGCSPVFAGYHNSCGSCSTVACATSTCDAKTDWKAKEAQTEWKAEVVNGEAAVPTPTTTDEAPRPKTFRDEPADPSKAQPTTVGKVVTEEASGTASGSKPGDPDWTKTGKPAAKPTAEVTTDAAAAETDKAATAVEIAPGNVKIGSEAQPGTLPAAANAQPETAGSEASTGFGETQREGDATVTPEFKKPVEGTETQENDPATPAKTPKLPDATDGGPATESAPSLDINLPLELENQSSWKVEFPVRRIAFRAGFGHVKIARTSVSVNVDYVVPTTVALQLVSR